MPARCVQGAGGETAWKRAKAIVRKTYCGKKSEKRCPTKYGVVVHVYKRICGKAKNRCRWSCRKVAA